MKLATCEMRDSFEDLLLTCENDQDNAFKAILRHASSMMANLAVMSEITTKRGTDHLNKLAKTVQFELARVAKQVA